jgi:hypothetical protein
MASGPNLGGKAGLGTRLSFKLAPSQGVEQGAEPLLFAATSPAAVGGGYYGPRWGLVGPAVKARPTSRAMDKGVRARLWAESERLTGVAVPAHV